MPQHPPLALAAKIRAAVAWLEAVTGRKHPPVEVAAAAGVSRTYYDNLTSGRQENPSVAALEGLAAATRVPARYFLPSCADDLEEVARQDSPQVRQLLELTRGMSAEQVDNLVDRVRVYRADLGLPPAAEQGQPSAAVAVPARRSRGRGALGSGLRQAEMVDRVQRSLRGVSPPDQR